MEEGEGSEFTILAPNRNEWWNKQSCTSVEWAISEIGDPRAMECVDY